MSRLYQRKKKQNKKIIILLILMIGVLIFVIINVGFDSLINSALFFTNISQTNNLEENSKSEEAFYGSINLDTPQVATNAATIIISGQAIGFDSVEFYLNNVKTETSTLNDEAVFSEAVGKLRAGENKIYAVARTKNGKNSKKTESYMVIYKRDAPVLKIERPQNGETVRKQDLEIVGNTDRNTSVLLNNSPIVVDLKGEFITTIRLKEGENNLNFTATDIAGNVTEISVLVKYERDD